MQSCSRTLRWSGTLAIPRQRLSCRGVRTKQMVLGMPILMRNSLSTTAHRSSDTSRRAPTHYELFPQTLSTGPPPAGRFNIDLNALRSEFLRLQSQTHPDRHPDETKRRAEAMSARLNDAYKTLRDPLLRTQYILSLRGIDVAEDETAKVEDPELLMEVLELREAIEEAESEEPIEAMKEENMGRIKDCTQRLEQAFEDDNVDTAKIEAVRLRYWVNIQQSLDEWEKGKPVVLVH